MGTLIRHTGFPPTMPPCALPVAVIETALGTPLMPAVGGAPLTALRLRPALETAIALSAVATAAEPEHSQAFGIETYPLPKNDFAIQRHPLRGRGFDNGAKSWQLQFESLGCLPREGCRATENPAAEDGGVLFPLPRHDTTGRFRLSG